MDCKKVLANKGLGVTGTGTKETGFLWDGADSRRSWDSLVAQQGNDAFFRCDSEISHKNPVNVLKH